MPTSKSIVLIPAIKKTVAFHDDLIKKLAGVSLIQRTIDKAIKIVVDRSNIHILTDSEEISLIAERNRINVYLDPNLTWEAIGCIGSVRDYLQKAAKKSNYALFLSPYAPLISEDTLVKALELLIEVDVELLKPVKNVNRQLYDEDGQSTFLALFGSIEEQHTIESKAFVWLKSHLLIEDMNLKPRIFAWPVENDLIEIESYQDWWVCEKLITRKRILFRVIGNEFVGMGHIYRSLSLAHEINDHEIIFVCDNENTLAANKIIEHEQSLEICEANNIVEKIINLKPDLVVNDILSTTKLDVLPLQKQGIKVINFEDLGEGARLADLTINELYDVPKFTGENILWGHKYFFVRDEFYAAKPHFFNEHIESILLVFGGTDQHNLSALIYRSIRDLCKRRNINVNIVTGSGYVGYEQLKAEIKDECLVTLTRATGVISRIMEQSQIAISSSGRTMYELAHMNIPSIIISQHEREDTHSFACEENGFIPLGVFEKEITEYKVVKQLTKLLDDQEYRHDLFERTKKYRFDTNKNKVVSKMLKLVTDQSVRRLY